ncbi:MalY/PatB family protein [Phytoactinopolyspora halotolerans]|uniref:cysteine-S-conjugate beta-lyase n=1 Tax=Phytoactinopolyspora halotolerans TaxID=1981512 RepID=A0A6L9SDJ0_9ACTN|nr:aminotransferase class I/II-fold pyridoxal phosphate-dependent enzyme [Phytoactinopolyspora halotolerans]NEE02632.1 aminotransferase class I/II-fold pyridoxal phosphate-dependent enzyme [Phytoactinopolyspora halotolerans]
MPNHAAGFDAITIESLRERGSVKWSTYPDAIGAFVAEMDFGTAPAVQHALHTAVDDASFGYLPQPLAAEVAEACASWQERRYGWPVDAAQVHLISDVIKGLQIAIEHFSRPGSPVVLPTPAYMPFLDVPSLMGRDTIEVPMAQQDGRWVYDLDALDSAFAAGGGLLVLCNPYNPLGRVMERDELIAISEVVHRHAARVFSDEIHSPLVYPGHWHVPYASISPTAAGHTVTATSASKAWNLPGLKCAQFIVSNDEDAEVWGEIGRMAGYGTSTIGAVANAAAYASGEPWLDDVVGYLDENRRLLASLLADQLPDVDGTVPEGTYLAWLDFRKAGFGDRPAALIRERAGVALVDGIDCGEPGRGFARLNFATPRPILEEIVSRIAGVAT